MKRTIPKVGDFICGAAHPATVVIDGELVKSAPLARPQPQPQPSAPSLDEIAQRMRDFKAKLDEFAATARRAKQ